VNLACNQDFQNVFVQNLAFSSIRFPVSPSDTRGLNCIQSLVISEYYIKMGLDVWVEEYYVNGRPDIIVNKDSKKIAIEIETVKSNYVGDEKNSINHKMWHLAIIQITHDYY
jgi:hypothetical protein